MDKKKITRIICLILAALLALGSIAGSFISAFLQ